MYSAAVFYSMAVGLIDEKIMFCHCLNVLFYSVVKYVIFVLF